MNHENIGSVASTGEIMVTLDCETVVLPAGRHSLGAIRSYLEFLALSGQRVLGQFMVDGNALDLAQRPEDRPFRRVDAITLPLSEMPLLLLVTASQQVSRARAAVENVMTLVLINDPANARELWWTVASQLKDPVLTLSLMPEDLCQSLVRHHLWQTAPLAA